MSGNKMGRLFGGLIVGTLAGTAIGLLLAPKPGKETREMVSSKASQLQNRAGGYVDMLRAKFKGDQAADAVATHADNHWTDGG
ncbi:MAG: YtxH domain-containing protein [Dehalococcoidia bacterium]